MKKQMIVILLLSVVLTGNIEAQSREARWLHSINHSGGSGWTDFNKGVSNTEVAVLLGVPLGMAIYDYVNKDADHFDRTLGVSASLAATYTASIIIKRVVRRDRPFEKYPGYIINRDDESGYSFPSNHTAGAFSLATSLSLNFPKWYIIAPSYAWASMVGYSRMQLGAHYPSDVLFGALLGTASAYGTYQLQKMYTKKRKLRMAGYSLQAYNW